MFRRITHITTFSRKTEGQTLSEYAFILALIALGAIVALGAFATAADGIFSRILTALEAVMP